jgi:hypothetical protein
MPITRTPMVDDDGTGTTGTIINDAWKQELYDQIDAAIAAGTLAASTELVAPVDVSDLTRVLEIAAAHPDDPTAARLIAAVRQIAGAA